MHLETVTLICTKNLKMYQQDAYCTMTTSTYHYHHFAAIIQDNPH